MPDVARLVAAVWDLWPVTEAGFRHRLASLPARARPHYLVGLREGEIVGWAPSLFAFEGERTDTAVVSVTVREDVRGRGLGARLLERCLERVRVAGATRVLSESLEGPGPGFLERRGFSRTFERRVSALDPREVDPGAVAAARSDAGAAGFEVVPFSACAPESVYRVDAEAAADIPQDEPASNLPFDEWLAQHWRHPLRSLEGSFAVRCEGQVVAVTLLRVDRERGRAGNDMTGTLREFRGRGLARLLKLCQAEWAAQNGITKILTENDETNRPMLAVNERLGFRPVASVYSYAREPL